MLTSLIHRAASLLLIGSLALSGCTEPERPQQPTKVAPPTPETAPAASRSDTTEYLDWTAARINGQLPLQSTPQAVWQLLGRPDSLVTPDWGQECVSFFSRTFRRGYVRGTVVEVYGDTAVVTSLDLQHQPHLTLHAGRLRLSYATTLTELAKFFPQSVRRQGPIDAYELGQVTEVSLPVSRALVDEDRWRLLFKNGRLVRIDYWMPC